VLYIAMKELQRRDDVNLHPTLSRVGHYNLLLKGKSRGFIGFLDACERAKLLKATKETYRISRRLLDAQDLHDIRTENPLQVHANEAMPVGAVREVLTEVLKRVEKISASEIAMNRFDDMVREHAGQRYRWGKKAPATVMGADNPHTGRPYLLMPELAGHRRHKVGVVLVDGFSSTPAELRAYADHLRDLGHVVLGVRLPGHGTSIMDLEDRSRTEWVDAVRDAYEVVAGLTEEIAVIGFSTGGAISLLLARENLPKMVRVASVSAPVLVQDGNMNLLTLGMVLRWILRKIPHARDMLRFYEFDRDTDPRCYPTVPLTALNELLLLIKDVKAALPKVSMPALVMQGLLDKTVKSQSASLIYSLLGSQNKVLRWIAGGPHGLIAQNFGSTWEVLDDFVAGRDLTGNTGMSEHKIVPEPRGKFRWPKVRITKKRLKTA